MKILIYLLLIALFIAGCSDGGSSFDSQRAVVTIPVGEEEVFVGPGDSITPDTKDTEIVVSHYLNNTKSVKVLKGSVSLLKGNFNVAK